MNSNNTFYLGTVVAVEDHELLTKSKEYREIVVDIPGITEGILAHPKSCELDEPKIGDPVIVECLDPVYKSYYTYYKLKENEFIGIRAAGKAISITPDLITIGVFDKDQSYKDDQTPELKSHITIDSDGNIFINAGGGKIEVTNATLKTNGGTSTANGKGGFCGIPTCPFTGAPHTSDEIIGIEE